MPSSTRPARRLPARVYWVRRALVLGTAFALVFALARLLGGSGAAPAATVEVTGGRTTPTAPAVLGNVGPSVPSVGSTAAAGGAPVSQVAPDGPCSVSDITITPVAGSAPAGRGVPLTLALTGIRPACTFQVTSKTVVAKVVSGKGKIWSSQDCPSSVRSAVVVVRSATPTTIQLGWSGRGSDSTCSRSTDWVLPGTYQVVAAAIGSEPSQADLKLTTPPRPVVIRTIAPKKPKATKTTKTSKTHKTTSPPTPPDTGHRRVS